MALEEHPVLIRSYTRGDAEATAQVFFRSVREGARDYYDEAQRAAWAPNLPEVESWCQRLDEQHVFIAERNGVTVGFMTLTIQGVIDLAFVQPEELGRGTGKQLYDRLLAEAHDLRFQVLRTEASHLARPFFERQGWSVICDQLVERRGVRLRNFVMRLAIG